VLCVRCPRSLLEEIVLLMSGQVVSLKRRTPVGTSPTVFVSFLYTILGLCPDDRTRSFLIRCSAFLKLLLDKEFHFLKEIGLSAPFFRQIRNFVQLSLACLICFAEVAEERVRATRWAFFLWSEHELTDCKGLRIELEARLGVLNQ